LTVRNRVTKLYKDHTRNLKRDEIILSDTAELWIKQYESASADEKAAKEHKTKVQSTLFI
jgi:hypothetical protein